jgi:hypothetical protein
MSKCTSLSSARGSGNGQVSCPAATRCEGPLANNRLRRSIDAPM